MTLRDVGNFLFDLLMIEVMLVWIFGLIYFVVKKIREL